MLKIVPGGLLRRSLLNLANQLGYFGARILTKLLRCEMALDVHLHDLQKNEQTDEQKCSSQFLLL